MSARSRDLLGLLLLTLAVGAPFLGKPFHIDDPFILEVSGNILVNPLDPFYGYSAWFGQPAPMWKMATNPPLLSYYLAPFAAFSDYSEWVLHAAMLPFVLLLAASALWLGRRFTQSPWLIALFVTTSVGTVVSGNVMRDVPIAGLSAAAVALCVAGSDRGRKRQLVLAGLVAGVAILTKYSAIVLVPLLLLYPLLHRRFRDCLYAALPLLLLGLWSLHNQIVYGETQVGLLLTRDWGPLRSLEDNLCGLPVIAGSLLYLAPALLVAGFATRDRVARWLPLVLLAVWWLTRRYLEGFADSQYLFWSLGGTTLIYFCAAEGLRGGLPLRRDLADARAADSLFLFAWLCAPLLFSVIFVPFQAVRHMLPALLPLSLLGLRALSRAAGGGRLPVWGRASLAGLVVLQATVALLVAASDYEHADAYRRAAAEIAARYADLPVETWYIGHWGWLFYGERAGLRALHPDGPYPRRGDYVVQPVNYYNGALPTPRRGVPRLDKVDVLSFPRRIPIRAMHPAGAGFYAMYSRRPQNLPGLPYRLLPDYPLESFDIYVAR
jgi:hypothetical protein